MCVLRCACVLLCVSVCVCLNLLDDPVTFTGPEGSLFGFSIDFHVSSNRSFIVVGAPKANTIQSGVREGGGVFLCPWSAGGGDCDIIDFDLTGDEELNSMGVVFQTSKGGQWFGASLRSVGDSLLMACAPLYHWTARRGRAESGKTPVGNCILLDQNTGNTTPFSPCREKLMDGEYKYQPFFGWKLKNDQRFCEVGFSADITEDNRLVFGAPGSLFFEGQVFTVALSDVMSSGRGQAPFGAWDDVISQTNFRANFDAYYGYSVATGQLTGDMIPDILVGVPNDGNTMGSVKIYDGLSRGPLRLLHTFSGTQVAAYFGHSVSVGDVNGDGLEDVLVGAPLFMDRVMEQLQERGQVFLYLQRRHRSFSRQPDQSLIGPSIHGQFGSALATMDVDMDGYHDVAVGAPWSGEGGRGQVFLYLGSSVGLSATPSQVINSPIPFSRGAFGFSLRSRNDIDGDGYPDLLVGAWAADSAFVYRSQAVIRCTVSLSLLPDFLNPDVKLCLHGDTPVSCFVVQVCVRLSGHMIPQETALGVELQLDKMKQPMARRTVMLSTNQVQENLELRVQKEVGWACINSSAYLRSEEEVRDKLSPIFISADISLLQFTQNAILYGQTHTTAQTRIILDCGDDGVCIPDLKLRAESLSSSVLVGDEQSLSLSVSAVNDGEGAFETELIIWIPEHTHFQSSQAGVNKLVCVQRKERRSVVVSCDLGNPMKHKHTVQSVLLFSVARLDEVETSISFSLRVRSKNSVNSSSNPVTVRVSVKAEATLEIRGGSTPSDIILPLSDWSPAVHPGSLEDLGPLVKHVYEMKNRGPTTVNVRLTVDFPSSLKHDLLLYVFSNASEESMTCWSLNASQIDPFKLHSNTSHVPAVPLDVRQGEAKPHIQTVPLNCSSDQEGCVRFVCDVMALERGSSAVIRISARLWTRTLAQNAYVNYDLISRAAYDVINTSSKVQPMLLQRGVSQTKLSVVWRAPDGEKEVPIGYIILSIICGLLLLSLLCLMFWKLGFFRRTRPPTDDDDDAVEEEEEEEGYQAEESHD